MTLLERAYHMARGAGMDPPSPPDLESPDELVQRWKALPPRDRAIAVTYLRLLAADVPAPIAQAIRSAVVYEEFLILRQAKKARHAQEEGTDGSARE